MVPLASCSVPSQSCTPFPPPGKPWPFPGQLWFHRKGFTFWWGFFSPSPFPPQLCWGSGRSRAGSAVPGAAPSPEPHSSLSCTHPPKPANNPPCTFNPLGLQLSHPLLEKEKGKNPRPGQGQDHFSPLLCVTAWCRHNSEHFSLGERHLLYEPGTLLLWKLLNITSTASEEFIQPPGC